jgi:pantoate--beta-alanine ligase
MGALHEGHLSLVRQALRECDQVIATIFVNPLQFGPKEDLARYPRPFDQDVALLSAAGCSVLFAPEVSEVYSPDASTQVIESRVAKPLCGSFRPGHFDGVTTVVLKLFMMSQPHSAYFGQKDAQQCAVIERMVRDLNIPIQLTRGDTVRETDGLAMSSRNRYLTADERSVAPSIYAALRKVKEAYQAGVVDAERLEQIGRAHLQGEPSLQVQYFELRDSVTLDQVNRADPNTTVFVAAILGSTRLIDNLRFS